MFIFPKKKKDKNTNENKEKYFLFWEKGPPRFDLAPMYLHQGGESGLRSSLDKIVSCFDVFNYLKILIFLLFL